MEQEELKIRAELRTLLTENLTYPEMIPSTYEALVALAAYLLRALDDLEAALEEISKCPNHIHKKEQKAPLVCTCSTNSDARGSMHSEDCYWNDNR